MHEPRDGIWMLPPDPLNVAEFQRQREILDRMEVGDPVTLTRSDGPSWAGLVSQRMSGRDFTESITLAFESFGQAVLGAVEPFEELADALAEIERDDDPHDNRRRPGEVPRPKTKPPMWAQDPTRTRRARTNTRRRHR